MHVSVDLLTKFDQIFVQLSFSIRKFLYVYYRVMVLLFFSLKAIITTILLLLACLLKNSAISLLNGINATIGIRDLQQGLTVVSGCLNEFCYTILVTILTIIAVQLLTFSDLRIAIHFFANIAALSRVLNISDVVTLKDPLRVICLSSCDCFTQLLRALVKICLVRCRCCSRITGQWFKTFAQ